MRTYTTKQGDMFDNIAYEQLGSVNFTDVLMKANLEYHADYVFSAGITLAIPDVSDIVTNDSLPPWKRGVK